MKRPFVMHRPEQGFVYILTNQAMPNLVKIGMTGRSAEMRCQELNKQSAAALPHPHRVVHSIRCFDPYAVEQRVHHLLKRKRPNPRREFFSVTPIEAKAAIEKVLSEPIPEPLLRHLDKQYSKSQKDKNAWDKYQANQVYNKDEQPYTQPLGQSNQSSQPDHKKTSTETQSQASEPKDFLDSNKFWAAMFIAFVILFTACYFVMETF